MDVTMVQTKPLVSLPGQGRSIKLLGAEVSFRAEAAHTNGLWSMVEYLLPPSPHGPALHYHLQREEIFYILEGVLQFTLNGETLNAPAGTLVVVPTGAPHTFKNTSGAPVRFQVWFSPAGFEAYFLELESLVRHSPEWPPADGAALLALMAKHDTYPA